MDVIGNVAVFTSGVGRREPASARRPSSGYRTTTDRLKVLVVDDFADARALYSEALAEADMDVHQAEDGLTALNAIARLEPDVVLMDLSMPGLDGWDATRAVRALPLTKQPYVIAVTAATGPDSRKLAYEAGCDAFIAKPCTPDVIVDCVRAIWRCDAS